MDWISETVGGEGVVTHVVVEGKVVFLREK